ncbi:MAG: MGMT family protein [Elusimicrobia bacterium]|nr:MGMT family protein [Elusimicrobiota bacterium]
MKAHRLPQSILRRMAAYTEFQRKVWLCCAQIPRGSTMTYGEVARKIGHPGAARAVGTALSKNPFAPTVPCHRVVAGSGKPGGYSGPGGIRKKLQLLKEEKASLRG